MTRQKQNGSMLADCRVAHAAAYRRHVFESARQLLSIHCSIHGAILHLNAAYRHFHPLQATHSRIQGRPQIRRQRAAPIPCKQVVSV